MTSEKIYKKVQQTRLFSDAQKIDILAKLPQASAADVAKLEAGIDVFDAEYAKIMKRRGDEIAATVNDALKDLSLEELRDNRGSVNEILTGLAVLTS